MIGALHLALVVVTPMQAWAGDAVLSMGTREPESHVSTQLPASLAWHQRLLKPGGGGGQLGTRSSQPGTVSRQVLPGDNYEESRRPRDETFFVVESPGFLASLYDRSMTVVDTSRYLRARPLGAGPATIAKAAGIGARQSEWFGSDKLRHFLLSMAVTQFTYGGLRTASANDDVALPIAIGFAAVAGVGKEVYDARNDGPFSLKDLTWDAAGIAIAGFLLGSVR